MLFRCWAQSCPLLAFLVATTFLHSSTNAKSPPLSKKDLERIEKEVVPAHFSGEPVALIKALTPFLANPNEARLEAVNNGLLQFQLPT